MILIIQFTNEEHVEKTFTDIRILNISPIKLEGRFSGLSLEWTSQGKIDLIFIEEGIGRWTCHV